MRRKWSYTYTISVWLNNWSTSRQVVSSGPRWCGNYQSITNHGRHELIVKMNLDLNGEWWRSSINNKFVENMIPIHIGLASRQHIIPSINFTLWVDGHIKLKPKTLIQSNLLIKSYYRINNLFMIFIMEIAKIAIWTHWKAQNRWNLSISKLFWCPKDSSISAHHND